MGHVEARDWERSCVMMKIGVPSYGMIGEDHEHYGFGVLAGCPRATPGLWRSTVPGADAGQEHPPGVLPTQAVAR